MIVETAKLPESLRSALASVGYGRRDVEITASPTYTLQGSAGDGRRNIGVAVNLETGEQTAAVGSWGGANAFERRQMDNDSERRALPVNGAYIYVVQGGGNPTYAHVYVHPSAMPAELETDPTEGATVHELFTLCCIVGLTSAGRKDAFDRARYGYRSDRVKDIGEYSAKNPAVAGVVARGWATANKAGAVQATTAGKNAREKAKEKLAALGIHV